MDKASMQECEMHTKEISSCCQEENTKEVDECCQDLLVDHSVKENYISSKIDNTISLCVLTFLTADKNFNSDIVITHNTFAPNLFATGSKIYLNNSILLI
jgi:hypothetical protein